MVKFKPNEYTRKMRFFSVYDTDGSEENIRLLSTGAELMSLRLPVQVLYHRATGDLWELRPLN